ncbi:hypothetical protein HMPREF9374_3980, partial [Desmospora sp. 8437]
FSAYGIQRTGATGCKPLNPLGGRTTPSELHREHPWEPCEKTVYREGWVSHGVILDRQNNETTCETPSRPSSNAVNHNISGGQYRLPVLHAVTVPRGLWSPEGGCG